MDSTTRTLLDKIAHPIFVLKAGDDGMPRYSVFNRSARHLIGRSEEEILGLTAAELFPGRHGQIALEHHIDVMRTGIETAYELSLPLKQGVRRIRTTLSPDFDEDGNIVMLFGSALDITEAQALQEMRAGAETLTREAGDFANTAALDLGGPMMRVKAIADMLRDGFQDLGDGKLELIDSLERLSSESLGLVTDVLRQVEAASGSGDVAVFDFAYMAEEIVAMVDPERGCSCEISPGQIRGDRTAIRMALRDLIAGALKRRRTDAQAQETGGPALKIGVLARGESYFLMSVTDNCEPLDRSSLSLLNRGTLRADSDPIHLALRRLVQSRGGRLKALNLPDDSGVKIDVVLPGVLRKRTLAAQHDALHATAARVAEARGADWAEF